MHFVSMVLIGVIRGLIFARPLRRQRRLIQFNKRNFNTIALSGDDPETSRATMERIELSSGDEKLDYILRLTYLMRE